MPSYWVPSRSDSVGRLSNAMRHMVEGPPLEGPVDGDVEEEQQRIKALLQHRTGGCSPRPWPCCSIGQVGAALGLGPMAAQGRWVRP